jgi:hypothetical protein
MPDTEMAELKQVIGQLWKSVDSFKLSSAEADHKTQQQIAEWTQINLQLLELLADKTQESIQLAAHYEQLTSYLSKFDRNCRSLNQQIKDWQTSSAQSTSRSNQEPLIMPKLQSLEHLLNQLNRQLYPLLNLDRSQWIWSYRLHWGISAIAVVFLCILMRAHARDFGMMHGQLDYITERMRWALTKLQRIEES